MWDMMHFWYFTAQLGWQFDDWCRLSSHSPKMSPPSTPTHTPRSPPGFPTVPQYSSPCPWTSAPRSPSTSPSPPRGPTTPTRPPPGFPTYPQYSPSPWSPSPQSPRSANINKFEEMFADADLKPDSEAEIHALMDLDPDGDLDMDAHGNRMFFRSDGPWYRTGHGRHKCSHVRCSVETPLNVPDNCGYSGQWRYPDQFRPCGDSCYGAFCKCLSLY